MNVQNLIILAKVVSWILLIFYSIILVNHARLRFRLINDGQFRAAYIENKIEPATGFKEPFIYIVLSLAIIVGL